MEPVEAVELVVEVNGVSRQVTVPPDRTLADLLRDDLGLTGTKVGCAVGTCGVCAVLVDGELASSCLTLAAQVDGRSIMTVEGLASDPRGAALQAGFADHGGFQCGYCTPGQLMTAAALLRHRAAPTPDDVRAWMTGTLCRCTGYLRIRDSVLAAATGSDGTMGEGSSP